MAAYYRTLGGDKSPAWRGGKGTVNKAGYLVVNRHGKVYLVHRLTMEEHLGRTLRKGETVHHINGIKTDNRIENLELCHSQSEHVSKNHRTPKRLPPKCILCDNPALARGVCNAHYKKARRYGFLHELPHF